MQQEAPTLADVLQGLSPDERARVERNARALLAETQALTEVAKDKRECC